MSIQLASRTFCLLQLALATSYGAMSIQLASRTFCLLQLALATSCGPAVRPVEPSPFGPALDDAIASIASRVDGSVAAAVVDIHDRSEAAYRGHKPMPQHSTYKLWLAVAVADAVERSEMRWEDTVLIDADDLIFSYQPIAEEVGKNGRAFTLAELARWMLVLSDNPSADALMHHLGGPNAVATTLSRIGVRGVNVTTNEAGLHSYAKSVGEEARALPQAAAQARVQAARATDPNPATALGIARSLARLARGELLGEDATRRILALASETETGADRLPAGLPDSWKLAHKTGTGHVVAGVSLGTNDIGILTAPSGKRYAVAVLIAGSMSSAAAQTRVIAEVARAVVDHSETPCPAR